MLPLPRYNGGPCVRPLVHVRRAGLKLAGAVGRPKGKELAFTVGYQMRQQYCDPNFDQGPSVQVNMHVDAYSRKTLRSGVLE